MFVCVTHYDRPVEPETAPVQAHWDYLDECFRRGLLVAAGPQRPRVGGVLVLTGHDPDEARALMDADPLVSGGWVSYRLIAFSATRAIRPELVDWPAQT